MIKSLKTEIFWSKQQIILYDGPAYTLVYDSESAAKEAKEIIEGAFQKGRKQDVKRMAAGPFNGPG